MKNRIFWITRTGVLIALLIALQWATSGLGQFVTGSCVNAVLVIATLVAGQFSGIVVALLSPFCAFLLGIGPRLIQIVPAIALGNVVFVWFVHILLGRGDTVLWQKVLRIVLCAGAKFLTLYIAVVGVLIPTMGPAVSQKQAQTFTSMFSWPQLVTALIGTGIAAVLLPMLRKAVKDRQ